MSIRCNGVVVRPAVFRHRIEDEEGRGKEN